MAARETGLVDHLGRPIRREVLTQEIAGPTLMGVRQVIGNHPEEGLTPQRLAGMLKAAEAGDADAYLELAEAMEEKDAHYRSVLATRKLAVAQLEITVEAGSKTPAGEDAANLVRRWIERDTLEDELFDVMDGLGKGYSVSELIWTRGPTQWLPERIEWRDPRWFEFDRLDGRTLLLRGETGVGEPLQPYKFLVHTPKTKSGMTIRAGLARVVAWLYLFKNYSVKDWVAFAEIYGLPLRIGKYEDGASEENIRKLARAVSQIGSDAAAVVAKSMDIEFLDGKRGGGVGGGGGEVFSSLVNFCDLQISKAVLGQTTTTDAVSGGHAVSKEHNQVRGEIMRADAKQLSASLNRDVVRPMVDLNLGPPADGAYPRIKIALPNSVDVTALAGALEKTVKLGLKVSMAEVREKFGLQAPQDGDELLSAPAVAEPLESPPVRTKGGGGLPTPADDPARPTAPRLRPLKGNGDREAASLNRDRDELDPIDVLIDEESGGWEELLEPATESLEQLLADCETLEEVRDRLAEAVGGMDVTVFAARLARAGFAARLAGASGQLLADVAEG